MTLKTRLDAFRVDFEAGKPPYNVPKSIIDTFHRATEELLASGAVDRAKKVGDSAPTFTLKDSEGNNVSSAELLSKGPLVVSFYRGIWCPYCNIELQGLQEALPEIEQRGASLVTISPQTAPNSRKSIRDNKLVFPILVDTKSEIAAAFGLKYELPDYLIELYRALKNDLPRINDDASWTLPMPARYVISRDGTIVYAEVNPDYRYRPEPQDMFPVIEEAAGTRYSTPSASAFSRDSASK